MYEEEGNKAGTSREEEWGMGMGFREERGE